MKKLNYILVPLVVLILFTIGLNKFLDIRIQHLLETKNLIPFKFDSLSEVKNKGTIANDYFLKNKDILMLGSSELSHSTRQHPTYYFNTNRSKNQIETIGVAYTQSLQDSAILGALKPDYKDNKVVLLVSMQWFMDKEGVSPHHYESRFSPSQFYAFLSSDKISESNKMYYAKRSEELLRASDQFRGEYLYAKLYNPDNLIDKTEKFLLHPYFKMREFSVFLKEKGLLYKKLIKSRNVPKHIRPMKPIDWNYEKERAIDDAKVRVGKNPFRIDKGYYNMYLRGKLSRFKGMYSNVNLLDSREYNDLDFEFKILHQLKIKPTIVVIPGMNKFYNLTGIKKKERYDYYDKIENMAKKYNYKTIDLRDKEGELYYLRDVMHLGTKGWVDVCEKLFKEFNQ